MTNILIALAIATAVAPKEDPIQRLETIRIAARASCRAYSSCQQAVEAWCAGSHPGADRDNDGIPCENVCPLATIGCSK